MPELPPKYFIDENLLAIGEALNSVRKDIVYPGHEDCRREIPRQSKDRVWLPIVGARGWAVILRDKRVRTRPAERSKLEQYKVRAFCLTGSGNLTSWDILDLLVRQWPVMERRLRETPGPLMYSVTTQGTKRLL